MVSNDVRQDILSRPAEHARLFDRLESPQPLGTQLGERVDDDAEDKVHGHSVDEHEEHEVKGHPPCLSDFDVYEALLACSDVNGHFRSTQS